MRLIIPFLCLVLSSPLLAQDKHLDNNLLGVKFGLGFSPALTINQAPHIDANGNETGYGLFSSPSPGIHGKVSYALQLRPNTFLELGILVGNESFHYEIRADHDFKQWNYNLFPFKATEFEMEYFGLSLQLQHHLPLSKRYGIFGGLGFSGVLFIPWEIEFTYSASREFEQPTLIYKNIIKVNSKEVIFYKVDLDVGLYYKIGSRFLLRPTLFYSYSGSTLLESKGTYSIFGDQEVITGTVSRKLRHLGFSVGFFVNF